jgi:hypothetical protein
MQYVLLRLLEGLSAHFYKEFAQGEVFLEPVDFFSQYTLPYHGVRTAQVLSLDPPRDKSLIIIHKDQPIAVPIQFLDWSQAILFFIDPVIPSYGVIVEQRLRNVQAALGEPGLDGFFSETICRSWFRPENLAEVGFVKEVKHYSVFPPATQNKIVDSYLINTNAADISILL